MGRKNTTIKPLAFTEQDVINYLNASTTVHLTKGELQPHFVESMVTRMTGKVKATKAETGLMKSILEGIQYAAEQTAQHSPDAILQPQDEDESPEVQVLAEDGTPVSVKLTDEPNEGDEAEEGEAKKGSIVPAKFRDEYKARGDATNCGDVIAKFLKRATVTSKGGSRVELLKSILSQNAVAHERWQGQLDSGKVGQFRMNSGNELRRKVAVDGFFYVPASVFRYLDAEKVFYADALAGFTQDADGNARFSVVGDEAFMKKWLPAKLRKAAAVSAEGAEKAMREAAEAAPADTGEFEQTAE